MQHRVQFGKRLKPATFAAARQVFGEALADLESRPSVDLVEFESERESLSSASALWQVRAT